MTFNYTSSVEKILKIAIDDLGEDVSDFKSIVHIHMTLNDGLLMGVNDNSQISNVSFKNDYLVKSTIVKPFVNREYDDGVDEKCRQLIDAADVVLLYGVSLGKTDAVWWQYIGDTMLQSQKILVYCPYDLDKNLQHKSQVLRKKRQFANYAGKALLLQNADPLFPINDILPIRENRMFDFGLDGHRVAHNYRLIYNQLMAKAPIKTTSYYTR